MKALITGINGFIASHLAEFLIERDFEVHGTLRNNKTNNIKHIKRSINIVKSDITNKKKTYATINKIKPDYVFHLAAQSFVMPSWKNPEETYDTNINGTYYLLDAIKHNRLNPVICLASSSAAYGVSYKNEIPIKETKEFRPSSPYALSKAATDMLGYIYWTTYKMKIVRLRFFNTVGPRKTGSAIAEWSQGIAEIEKRRKSFLGIGNLASVVDISDIKDSINAIWLLSNKGKYGEAYNICSGKGYEMKDILNKLIKLSTTEIKIREDPKKIRPADDPIFIGDNSKLKNLGWKPEIPLENTLKDTLDYWRSIV